MKLAPRLFCLAALWLASLPVACTQAETTAESEEDLTGMGTGTYVLDARAWGEHYVDRITFSRGSTFEAEFVSASGVRSLVAGTYDVLPARPNNPDSPVKSDKPTLMLRNDSGGPGASFEFDKEPGSVLRFYHSVRRSSFTLKKDPNYAPAPTNTKTIACTGERVDAKLTLDQAQNRRGTLKITRKASATDRDVPNATVTVTKNENGASRDYLYFEGMSGEQDYYVNMIKSDYERGSGDVKLNLQWAQGGQQWGVGVKCAFAR